MAISFPSSPSTDDVYTYNGTKYVYDGVKWVSGGSTAFLLKAGDTITGLVNSSSTDAFGVPVGTTAERPTGADGLIRYNSTDDKYEGYADGSWGPLGGGATGGGSDRVFHENDQTVTTDYTLTSGKNAMTVGPVSVDSGATVTVPSGQTWTIV